MDYALSYCDHVKNYNELGGTMKPAKRDAIKSYRYMPMEKRLEDDLKNSKNLQLV